MPLLRDARYWCNSRKLRAEPAVNATDKTQVRVQRAAFTQQAHARASCVFDRSMLDHHRVRISTSDTRVWVRVRRTRSGGRANRRASGSCRPF